MPIVWSVQGAASKLVSAETRRKLRRRASRMLTAVSLADPSLGLRDSVEAGFVLAGDAEIRELNRRYRGIDRPTDVLAFAQREGLGGDLHPGLLGDVIVSVETAQRQAKGNLPDEILFLWSHGLCHLLGYDHQTRQETQRMDARSQSLLAEARRRGRIRPA
ncbi:MAG: rRNA maturation RNase YbeY [Pseudomonadota bacterium]